MHHLVDELLGESVGAADADRGGIVTPVLAAHRHVLWRGDDLRTE